MCYVNKMVAFELRHARSGACQSTWREDCRSVIFFTVDVRVSRLVGAVPLLQYS
jgi:hypothetical protein